MQGVPTAVAELDIGQIRRLRERQTPVRIVNAIVRRATIVS